eukprot:9897265-Karenia_brevis.AAC.1
MSPCTVELFVRAHPFVESRDLPSTPDLGLTSWFGIFSHEGVSFFALVALGGLHGRIVCQVNSK